MWVYMATWIVKDGAPELGRGSFLPGVGLRADCLSVSPARAPVDGIAEWADAGSNPRPGGHVHELTGLAGPPGMCTPVTGPRNVMPARSS
jgi:hypothetical protein